VLLAAVARRLREMGAQISLGTTVDEVLVSSGSVQGLRVNGEALQFDRVISTIPLPYLVRMVPGLPEAEREKIAAVRNVGVVCVLLKLKRRFTRNFWMNINDPRIEIPGLIEYTNLNPLDGHTTLVYAPYYMPSSHPKYGRDAKTFIDETLSYMRLIRDDFEVEDVVASAAHRYEFAQTVCTPGFYEKLPPMSSEIAGLFMADTSHYYPEDRSICESMALGAKLARLAREK
jgi:protoporphyrinogen oxidase